MPAEEPAIVAHFLDRLYVAHGRAERLLRRGLSGVPSRTVGAGLAGRLLWERTWRLDPASGAIRPEVAPRPGPNATGRLWEGVAPLLEAVRRLADRSGGLAGVGDAPLGRSILLRDYAGHGRRQVVLFVFEPDAPALRAVVKVAHSSAGADGDDPGSVPLAGEARALRRLHEELGPLLAATVPAPLAYVEGERAGVLTLAPLGGRSAYVELQNRFLPASRVRPHLWAAADWLAAFHRSTRRRGERTAPTDADRAHAARLAGRPAGEAPTWLERLGTALEDSPLPLSAGHGDFWARNLLLGGARGGESGGPDGAVPPVGVVDWEHFTPAAPPFVDLFHFALSYGRAYRWRGAGRTELPDAFRRTFLEENHVSRAVAEYLDRYARGSGLDPTLLGPLLRLHLLRRHREAVSPGERRGWEACVRALAEARDPPGLRAGARSPASGTG